MTSVFSWQNSISLCPVFFIYFLFIYFFRLKHIFINQNRNHYNQHIFVNKFFYSCCVKICALGLDKLLESIFCFLMVVEAFSLEKVVEMLEEVVVSW